jgi:hypothetical protein
MKNIIIIVLSISPIWILAQSPICGETPSGFSTNPEAPSAADLNGTVNLGDATVQQQEKIEEIYLHLIEMNKEIKALKAENAEYSAQVERLKQEIEDLK